MPRSQCEKESQRPKASMVPHIGHMYLSNEHRTDDGYLNFSLETLYLCLLHTQLLNANPVT